MAFQVFLCGSVGGCLGDQLDTDSAKSSFIFSFRLSLSGDMINCTVRLFYSQAEKMNQVIEPCAKVWFATTFLSYGRVVLVFLSFHYCGFQE